MEKLDFYIVDVFAEEKYAGNQLAVIKNAKALTGVEMQRIAKEMNYSETTFILSDVEQDGGYNVRIFTPEEEVPFAGHPTLGTAYIVQREIIKNQVEKLSLNYKCGQIPVTLSYNEKDNNILWMKQISPTFSKIYSTDQIGEILNIDKAQIDDRFPIQEVSTGLPFIIVPLRTMEAIKQVNILKDQYWELVRKTQAKAILVFCPETYHKENDLNVRVFTEYYGIPEDPATGSANGCLAGYLVKHRYLGKDKINIRTEQGHEIGRPSLLYLRSQKKDGDIDVQVGGKVVMVARGELV